MFTVPVGHPSGTASALGDLTVTELQNVDQQWLAWGMETDELYDITATTGALFYEAELMTTANGSTTVTVAGASGGTPNMTESTGLPPTPLMMMRTEIGVGKLTHVGEFRVIARVMNTAATTGSVTVRLDWGVGDLATYTSNQSTTLTSDMAGTFRLVDLGLVRIPSGPVSGVAQRWDGRIMASSTLGDKLRVDCLMLFPTMSGGEAAATNLPPTGSTLVAFDSFDQTAGALAGKTVPLLATAWTFQTGDTDDWSVDATNHWATRTVTANDTAARLVSAGTANYADVGISRDIFFGTGSPGAVGVDTGIFCRYVDASNYLSVSVGGDQELWVRRVVAGVENANVGQYAPISLGVWYTLTVYVNPGGGVSAFLNTRGGTLGGISSVSITDPALATGGVLATGKAGLWERIWNSTFVTAARHADNFTLYSSSATTPSDAVLFRIRSLRVTHERVIRQAFSLTGSPYQSLANYEGDYLKIPAVTRRQRRARFIVKASRSILGAGADSGIDDIQATLSYTPRYLSVPAPT